VTYTREKQEATFEDRKRLVARLFDESGDIAPVDFGRYGKRAGEIIAKTADRPRKRERRRRH
jgi:hypothetical protein